MRLISRNKPRKLIKKLQRPKKLKSNKLTNSPKKRDKKHHRPKLKPLWNKWILQKLKKLSKRPKPIMKVLKKFKSLN